MGFDFHCSHVISELGLFTFVHEKFNVNVRLQREQSHSMQKTTCLLCLEKMVNEGGLLSGGRHGEGDEETTKLETKVQSQQNIPLIL